MTENLEQQGLLCFLGRFRLPVSIQPSNKSRVVFTDEIPHTVDGEDICFLLNDAFGGQHMGRRRKGLRVLGPYPRPNNRAVLHLKGPKLSGGTETKPLYFDSEAEALKAKRDNSIQCCPMP